LKEYKGQNRTKYNFDVISNFHIQAWLTNMWSTYMWFLTKSWEIFINPLSCAEQKYCSTRSFPSQLQNYQTNSGNFYIFRKFNGKKSKSINPISSKIENLIEVKHFSEEKICFCNFYNNNLLFFVLLFWKNYL
jgi:hypothetical protein